MNYLKLSDHFNESQNPFVGRDGIVVDVIKSVKGRLVQCLPGEILCIDLSDAEIMDFSFAHELIINTLLILGKGALEDKYLVFSNPSTIVNENLRAALNYDKAPAIILHPDGKWDLGWSKFPEHYLDVLKIIVRLQETESHTISKELNISMSNCNNRLKQLYWYNLIYRKRLFQPSGGLEYKYISLIK